MSFSPPAEFASVDNILILVVVVLLVFGSTQIPKLARSLGSAQKEFKKGLDEGAQDDPKAAAAEVQPRRCPSRHRCAGAGTCPRTTCGPGTPGRRRDPGSSFLIRRDR